MPLPVFLKRFFAPEWDFIFGMPAAEYSQAQSSGARPDCACGRARDTVAAMHRLLLLALVLAAVALAAGTASASSHGRHCGLTQRIHGSGSTSSSRAATRRVARSSR